MPEAGADRLPDAGAIGAARERLRSVARETPLQRSAWLSEVAGTEVHLKLECWQRTHSFKFRGAYNAVGGLDPAILERGLTTASAGNHGQGLALAARLRGARATVFVPTTTPTTKKSRIRRYGAELREVPGTYDDAAEAARAHARDSGAYLLHPFVDPAVVAGQATVGLEILDALPSVRDVVVPVGGGGLLAGVGAALAGTGARVVGVQSTATRAMHDAFEAGRLVPVEDEPTLCDGLAGETEAEAFDRARAVTEEIHLVDEARVAPAIRSLYREEGLVAEGAGAVGVAAVLAGAPSLEGPVAVVISGGNIDAETLGRILAS